MNLQLHTIHLVSGPERPRTGNNLVIGLEAAFTVDGQMIRSAGIGIVHAETPDGYQAAIEEAVEQARKIAVNAYDPFVTSSGVPAAALTAAAKLASSQAIANAKLQDKSSMVENLEKPADETQQRQLDQVCAELGISPIKVEGLENGVALCMLKALESLLTEVKPNPEGN